MAVGVFLQVFFFFWLIFCKPQQHPSSLRDSFVPRRWTFAVFPFSDGVVEMAMAYRGGFWVWVRAEG